MSAVSLSPAQARTLSRVAELPSGWISVGRMPGDPPHPRAAERLVVYGARGQATPLFDGWLYNSGLLSPNAGTRYPDALADLRLSSQA